MTDPRPGDAPRIGPGRPAIEATTADIEKIETMAGYGLTQGIMAHVLGWSDDTFTRLKQEDPRIYRALERGGAFAQLNVGQALYLKATGQVKTIVLNGEEVQVYTRAPETAAIRWWEMTRAGRADRVREVEPEEDHPHMRQVLEMSTEEKITGLRELLEAHAPKPNGKHGNGNGRNGKRSRSRR